ncbi:MAG: histidinol-phosphate transaminase [Candidatus Adiutrix sp.]|jgi:histidinol-phosphate aminotransferase|nr:histidinol-phosphate transaminase [Candidatus Adiutrix sp.]
MTLIPEHIAKLSPYVPGRLIEDVEAELGLTGIIKLASNENSLGASPKALAAMRRILDGVNRYGDADSRALKEALCRKFGFDPATVVTGNGSSEFILVLCHTLLDKGLTAIMSRPSFTLYAKNAQAAGAEALEAPLTADYGHDLAGILKMVDERTRLVFLDNPLNPTGAYIEPEELMAFHRALPEKAVLVVDEAYVEFARKPKADWRPLLQAPGRLVVMRTFSKAYGLAGLRAAYALMSPALAAVVNKVRQPFNMNNLAQAGAAAALDDDEFVEKTLAMTWHSLDTLAAECTALGLTPDPTEANYLMVGLGGRTADKVFQAILRRGVITRSLTSFGLTRHLRVNAGLESETAALVNAFREVLQ